MFRDIATSLTLLSICSVLASTKTASTDLLHSNFLHRYQDSPYLLSLGLKWLSNDFTMRNLMLITTGAQMEHMTLAYCSYSQHVCSEYATHPLLWRSPWKGLNWLRHNLYLIYHTIYQTLCQYLVA